MTPPIRAMVVDDEPLARVSLRSLLASESAWQLVGEWGSGAAALQGITKDPPDVVFLDIRMPGLDGLEVARRLSSMPRPASRSLSAGRRCTRSRRASTSSSKK